MRIFLILWAFPLIFFWGWYGLSAYDINFGIQFLSRRTHDIAFNLYGNILGMPAAGVPLALVKIFAFDSLFVVALVAWRWRKSWYPQTKKLVMETYHSLRAARQDRLNSEEQGQEWLNRPLLNQETASGRAHPAE